MKTAKQRLKTHSVNPFRAILLSIFKSKYFINNFENWTILSNLLNFDDLSRFYVKYFYTNLKTSEHKLKTHFGNPTSPYL